VDSIATELGPEILEMKISIAGWCFADKKMVLWMMAHHVLTTTLHYSGQATKTLFIMWGNQKSNCWALSSSEKQFYNNPWNPNITS